MNPDKFARLAKRLESRPDRSDHGQLLPLLAAALDQNDPAVQLVEAVQAIQLERVIVPVPVEEHPDATGEHRPQDLSPEANVPLAVIEQDGEGAIAIFSSARALLEWDPKARPLAMQAQKAALTAAAAGVPRLRLDPAGANLLIPRAAVEALAAGGSWLPAWDDQQLADSLRDQARRESDWATFVDVRVYPATAGAIMVEVLATPRHLDPALVRSRFAELLSSLGRNPRLSAGVEAVQFVPRLVPQT